MKTLTLVCLSLLFSVHGVAQEEEDIVKIIDDLTIAWDEGAEKMATYKGLGEYCGDRAYRVTAIALLNKIHHYDTVLYQTVTSKYEANKDPEAKATIDDIIKLEVDYTTKSFLQFLHKECNTYNMIENNLGRKGGKEYKKEVKSLEKELSKYVKAITERIDVIDEHVHHLKDL